MKNKLTVNDIALANIRQRKKQYLIMIIGIVLAMVFSGSIVFFMAAAKETSHAEYVDNCGCQDTVIDIPSFGDKDYEKAKNSGAVDDYAIVDILGYAYKNDKFKRLGSAVGRANDKFREISNQRLLEGRLPEAENEIAIESEALKKLDYRNASVGSTISLKFMVQNAQGYAQTVDKEYVVTGILKDKKSNIGYSFFSYDEYDTSIPAIFVADNTILESGGKAKQIVYLEGTQKRNNTFNDYLAKNYGEDLEYDICSTNFDSSSVLDYYQFANGDLIIFIALLLVFTSCVGIVNSFNNNLKERRQQIGMLRAVGTTRRQIIRIFGREAFIIALISTPISILISYLLVYLGINLMSDNAVMTKSIWTLPIAAVINMTVVMLAALVPLIFASHISPMQAIRDVRIQRKAKVKKIHSKMQYKPAAHLARRNGQFYKGSKIAVGVILSLSVMLSAFGFSYLSYEKDNKTVIPYDYVFWCGNSDNALSDVDKQNIVSNPLVETVVGEKSISSAIKADYSSMFMRVMNPDRFLYNYDSDNEDYSFPTTVEEYKNRIQNNKGEPYAPDEFEGPGITDDMWSMTINSYDRDILSKLEDKVYDGKIDYNKLRSGEEVILVMPKKAELMVRLYHNGMGSHYNYDDDVGKPKNLYKTVMTENSPYKAGDEIEVYSSADKAFKTVRIGALVSCSNDSNMIGNIVSTYSPHIITSNDGILNFNKEAGYENLYISLYDEPNDKTDAEFTEFLDEYKLKYDGFVTSTYEDNQTIEKNYRSMVTAMLVVLITGFAVCVSIINNSITAQIRENKRVIGTLRAVGASRSELVKSYCLRMLSMFTWGAGVGFGLYIIGFIVIKILCRYLPDMGLNLVFSPWASVIMVAVLFVFCFINLFSKISKEMKNSIVENIREL